MPTLSASDYTRYIKLRSAANSYQNGQVPKTVQTTNQPVPVVSILNAEILASQAAFVTTPATSSVTRLAATVSAVSTTTVTDARTDIISSAGAGTNVILYTCSQAHGLVTGDLVTISGFAQSSLSVDPNWSTPTAIVRVNDTSFTIASTGVTGTATGTGSLGGRVYYTTSVANGLVAGDVISVTGITTFTASGATVLAAPSATTFVLSSATTGSRVQVQSGTITGLVYYTTGTAHGIFAGTPYVTITGLTGTTAYNQSLVTVYRVPSSTVFIIRSSATGTAITSQTGAIDVSVYANTYMAVTNLARVRPLPVVQFRSNPDARSTVSYAGTSGALGPSVVQRPGGLPAGFKSSTSTYTRLPQQAGW
jgi:hypothetical protein